MGGPGGGTTVTNYDPRDTEQLMEMIALGLGYNNLRTSARWDLIMAQNEHVKYIDAQRLALMAQFFEAHAGENEAEMEKVKDSIRKFNDGLAEEDRGKAITTEGLRKSLIARYKGREAREAGVPTIKGNVPIARSMQELFPEATVDVRRVR